MSLTAKAYISSIIALGALVLWHGLFPWNPQDPVRFLWYLALAVPASCLKVRLPGVTGTMSVLFLFLLAGIVELGLPETLVIAATCTLVQCFWHAKARPRIVQVLFGVAASDECWGALANNPNFCREVPLVRECGLRVA